MNEPAANEFTVAVVAATGHTGRFVIADLLRRGITPIAIARNAASLEAADFDERVIRRHATVEDTGSLDRALEGARAVINAAGPYFATAEAVASAALRARIHYTDFSAEQEAVANLFEKFNKPAREAGLLFLPALAFFGGLSDLMVTALMEGWDAADSVETYIGFDRWHPTKGSRNTIDGNYVGDLVFTGGCLTKASSPPAQKPWVFADPVGDQVVLELPLCETILITRHVKTAEHHNYLTQVAIQDVTNPSTPFPKAVDELGRSAQNFVVDVVVSRGNERRRAFTRGRDAYAVSAVLTGEVIDRLLRRQFIKVGVRAPGEVFPAAELLKTLGPEYATFKVLTTS